MVDRLSNLVAIFENPALDFSKNKAEGDDLLGDAYEYLMRNFATESGKSKGQFYTPAEVSRVMAKIIGLARATRASQTIYDPTCGSSSLLLKADDEAPVELTLYGQEMDNATAALGKMNMILHGNETADIRQGNTLASPLFLNKEGGLKTFDFIVANFPFSAKAWSSGFYPAEDVYGRFELGVPPQKNGDYAFLLHTIASLKSTGKAAVILPHGVLFRGNAEGAIRRKIVERGYIQGIIGLPPNLFYGTGIPACIIVLDKEQAQDRRGIFLIDASKGFVKDGNKNRLRHQDIHKIVDVFNRRLEIPKYSRFVPIEEIAANDYNLNIPRYIDSSAEEDLQDIAAHLLGGIPDRDIAALGAYWEVLPGVRGVLFGGHLRPGYSELKVASGEIKAAILGHPEFAAYRARVQAALAAWQEANEGRLKSIAMGDHPKQLIELLGETLLHAFAGVPLIDQYDIYQQLMTYWTDAMQDDVYLITVAGWCEAARLRPLQGAKSKEKPDFVVGKFKYKADLIPPALIVQRYFAAEQAAVDALRAELEAVDQEFEALVEEHGGEEGILEAARNDKGILNLKSVQARIKELERSGDKSEETAEELAVLRRYRELTEKSTALRIELQDAQGKIETAVFAKYDQLVEEEIKGIVVDDKWMAALASAVEEELDRVSRSLTGRTKVVAERYATPLPRLAEEVASLGARVDGHLRKCLKRSITSQTA